MTFFKIFFKVFCLCQLNAFGPYISGVSDMQCNCMMGVFPEISRAWLTIDSDIFLWNYEDGYVDNMGLIVFY